MITNYDGTLKNYVNEQCWPAHKDAIVFLSGHSGSGKDTLAGDLVFNMPNVIIEQYAFADTLKETASALTGIPVRSFYDDKDKLVSEVSDIKQFFVNSYVNGYGHKAPHGPETLVEIGEHWTLRSILLELGASGNHFPLETWANNVCQAIKTEIDRKRKTFGNKTHSISLITDLRYRHEFDIVRKAFSNLPYVILHLDTGEKSRIEHESETQVDDTGLWADTNRQIIPARPVEQFSERTYWSLPAALHADLSKEVVLASAIGMLEQSGLITQEMPEE